MCWFYIASLCDWLIKKIRAPLSATESEVKPKPIVTYSQAFSRAWQLLNVFASNSDWLIGLSVSVVIGQSDYVGFGINRAVFI